MHADADEIQGIARGRRDGGAVVGVVGGLEHRLDVDRGHQLARQRPLMGAAQLFQRGAIDEHRLADQRRIGPPAAVAIGLAHHVAVGPGQAAGQEGCDIRDLPGGEVAAQDQGGLGVVDHRPYRAWWGRCLEGLCMSVDQIRFDEPQAGLVRLAARFGGHAYDLHRHETYAVGLTLWGAQSFHYRGALQTSRGGQVMVIHPDEAHDGHATNNQGGVADGFAYRMLYVDPASVSAALEGASPPFVPDVVADDAVLAGLLGEAFADLPQALEPLALDAIVERLAGRLAARSDARPRARRGSTAHRAVARARDFLAAEAHRTVASEELEKVPASIASRSPAISAPSPAPRRIATRSAGGWRGPKR